MMFGDARDYLDRKVRIVETGAEGSIVAVVWRKIYLTEQYMKHARIMFDGTARNDYTFDEFVFLDAPDNSPLPLPG
jgi:hypothetical protein